VLWHAFTFTILSVSVDSSLSNVKQLIDISLQKRCPFVMLKNSFVLKELHEYIDYKYVNCLTL